MACSTDIPDWCLVEAGLPVDLSRAPTVAELQRMREVSPIAYASKIEVPMLILVGAKDRRVPPPQGPELYAALKGAGKPVRMHIYPGAFVA